MRYTPKSVTKRSRRHINLNNTSRILMPLKGQQVAHRKFSCVVLMLLIITAITRRRQGQLSRAALVPADERKLTLTAANLGLDE